MIALTKPGTNVPWRDSKLTTLLHDSLTGNSNTTMLIALGPAARDYYNTLESLSFASRLRQMSSESTATLVSEEMGTAEDAPEWQVWIREGRRRRRRRSSSRAPP